MSFSLETTDTGTDLVVTGEWSTAAAQALADGRADGLVLNYAKGFREQPLDFIDGLPIRKLDLLARSIDDLSPIYSLASSLQELRVQSDPRAVIELERLPTLRSLSAAWSQVRGSIMFAPQLESLAAAAYDEPDLSALVVLQSLSKLVMKERPRLRSLDGVEAIPWLMHLGIHLARGLSDISALEAASSTILQVLQIQSCKSIVDIGPIAACPSLQFFDLSEGAEIGSVEPLGELMNLERLHLYGSTKVRDGDLGPIARLPKLKDFRIQNRRHYSPLAKDIQDAISRRG
jgi:hypothetical protein